MIPLIVRSYYSLMWGTSSPAKICSAAKSLGYKRIALTDTDNLYGLRLFLNNCKHEGILPIVGAEITDPQSDLRVVCLVENDSGYKNLCRLITRRHCKEPFNLKNDIIACAKGLIILTRSAKLLADLHEAGAWVAAAAPRKPDAASVNLKKTAGFLGVPMAAVPGSFFLDPEDTSVHRLLRAIDLNTSLFKLSVKDVAPSDSWLSSPKIYKKRFEIWPDAVYASESIAERLSFTGPCSRLVMPPRPDVNDKTAKSARESLRQAAYEGAQKRYGYDLPENVVDRLEHELNIIEKMGFSSYFLVVRDIVSLSPRICGRGSGAASLVAYCLGITNVCPVKHNLYFERFLNPGRLDPPDIDVDFAWDERDGVLNFVLEKYCGYAAMVCNHVGFKPRMAIRETAKVFGLTDQEIGQVCKKLPWFWQSDFYDDDLLTHMLNMPEMSGLDFKEPWPEIVRLAQKIIGIPRYLSVHPGGVVITPLPIEEYVPVEIAPKGVPIIQWEKDGTEESGLVKIDLLGNRSLGVIRDAIANIRENGVVFDEKGWEPEDDPATRESIAKGLTMGCFYIESPAMRLLQQKTKKGDFEHLVIHSSIIRPAANEFIREYVRRLHGGKWAPIHPLLEGVLEETYGIMVYQEDVSKTAVALAGFSHAEADGLRKIMSKKDKARRLEDYRVNFYSGARQRGLSDDQINAVWNMMMSFSGYSFCKPHSASYAKVSFQAAYLKIHYPAEFMAAVISNQGGFYNTFAYVSEAKRIGVKILPPDVNQSEILWKGRQNFIRVGFLSVKNLSGDTQKRIILNRKEKQFENIADFLERVAPDETEAKSLIHSGAFNSICPDSSHADLLWELSLNRRYTKEKELKMFEVKESVLKPFFPEEDSIIRMRYEYEALGFLCARHPMELHEDALKGQKIVKAKDLPCHVGKHIRAAGLLITGKLVHTKHGEPMEFLTFEDETGLIETVFFPKTYQKFCSILDKSRPFILSGKVEEDFGAVTLAVSHAGPFTFPP